MAFTLLACSDIRAQKINLELPFENPPCSMDDLRAIVQAVFRSEETALKQSRGITDSRPCEPFTLNRVQRYDDDTQRWFDVTSVSQLQPYDQLYIFRKNSSKSDISPQRELPAPRISPYFVVEVQQKTRHHNSESDNGEGGGAVESSNWDEGTRPSRRRRHTHRRSDAEASPIVSSFADGARSSPPRRAEEGGAGGGRGTRRHHAAPSMRSLPSGSDGVARGINQDEREAAHSNMYHHDSDHNHRRDGNHPTMNGGHRRMNTKLDDACRAGEGGVECTEATARSPRRARSGSASALDSPPRARPTATARHTSAASALPYPLRSNRGNGTGAAAVTDTSASLSHIGGGLRSGFSATAMHHCVNEGARLEQVRYLFNVADEVRSGVMTVSSFECIFRSAEIHFPLEVLHDLFHRFARQERGRYVWMLEDFYSYAEAFPVAVSVAYQRLTNRERVESLRQDQLSNTREMAALQTQLADLEVRLSATRSDLIREEQRHSQLQDEMAALTRQQDKTYCREEQTVMDKEVSVFRYRERLAREERDYERLALERQRRTVCYTGGAIDAAHGGGGLSGRAMPNGSYDCSDERYGPLD